jgi:hypothetical protein
MKQWLLIAISLVVLSACAGGGGNMSPPSSPTGTMPSMGTQSDASSSIVAQDTVSILNQLHNIDHIGSTVDPNNGDQNPYCLDIAKITAGKITAGDLVVCNFNNAANVQGTGTTIIALHPAQGSVPRHITQSASLLGTTEFALDQSDHIFNAVFVANNVVAFGPGGGFADTLPGPWDKPFGITLANETGLLGERVFYISNAGPSGKIVRVTRDADNDTFAFDTIATGFPVNGGVPGTELGPSGLQYDSLRDRLYIVDGTNDTVYFFSHASKIPAGGITVSGKTFSGPFASSGHVLFSGAPIHGPISSALLFNGNLVIGNTTEAAGNHFVEFSPAGHLLATKNVDNGATGSTFGMVATGASVATTKIYFNDDNANQTWVVEP